MQENQSLLQQKSLIKQQEKEQDQKYLQDYDKILSEQEWKREEEHQSRKHWFSTSGSPNSSPLKRYQTEEAPNEIRKYFQEREVEMKQEDALKKLHLQQKQDELKHYLSHQIDEKRRLAMINKELNTWFADQEMQIVVQRDESQK